MTKLLTDRVFHPYIAGVFPVAALYMANFENTALADLPLPLLAAAIITAATVLLAWRWYASFRRAALAASFLVVLTFSYHDLDALGKMAPWTGLALFHHRYFIIARYFGLMFDAWVGADYEQGLANLKRLVEQGS